MSDTFVFLDPDSSLSLQNQIRRRLVDGVLSGALPPGHRIPSSRKLAQQLGIARNTVVLAYQQLIAEGYLISRSRSGIFVNDEILHGRVGYGDRTAPTSSGDKDVWTQRMRQQIASRSAAVQDLPNWNHFPYPFIDGKFDQSLFPITEWREANRLALGVAEVGRWSTGTGDADDPMLIDEIRSKILTRRGIQARQDEILITLGTQNSLYLVTSLLLGRGVTVAVEEPGNNDSRELFHQSHATVTAQPVDEQGIVVDENLAKADLVYVTPSHQIPTAVFMSRRRRKALLDSAHANDFVIVEDDYECEINYLDQPKPALRSMDDGGRVIYVASFSKVLSPGLRLGFIVADAEFIRRARSLRRTMLGHPPLYNQRVAAYFLSLGHYDSLMLRLGRVLRERRAALHDALNWMRGVPLAISPEVGGTTYWVRMPDDFDIDALASAVATRGVLIEPVKHYYASNNRAENCFRMGVTSLPIERIRTGVTRLVEVIRAQVKNQVESLSRSGGQWLKGEELQSVICGATILYQEVDGAPCTIRYLPDGTMTGVLGYSNEERDTGNWFLADDRLHRQWSRWNYGELNSYSIVVEGDHIKFFNSDGQVVDSAFLLPAEKSE